MRISANPNLVKIMTHNSTNNIVKVCSPSGDANKTIIGKFLVSVKNVNIELKINKIISSMIGEVKQNAKIKDSILAKQIKTMECKSKRLEGKIEDLSNKDIKLKKQLSSAKTNRKSRELSTKLQLNHTKFAIIKEQKNTIQTTIKEAKDKRSLIDKTVTEIEQFNFIADSQSKKNITRKIQNSDLNTSKTSLALELKLGAALNKKEKYESAIKLLNNETKNINITNDHTEQINLPGIRDIQPITPSELVASNSSTPLQKTTPEVSSADGKTVLRAPTRAFSPSVLRSAEEGAIKPLTNEVDDINLTKIHAEQINLSGIRGIQPITPSELVASNSSTPLPPPLPPTLITPNSSGRTDLMASIRTFKPSALRNTEAIKTKASSNNIKTTSDNSMFKSLMAHTMLDRKNATIGNDNEDSDNEDFDNEDFDF